MSKADDVFWREFGVILLGLTAFTLIVFFAARAIGAGSTTGGNGAAAGSPRALDKRARPRKSQLAQLSRTHGSRDDPVKIPGSVR